MGRHEDTLRAIFEVPTRSDASWRDALALLRHLGGTISEGKGSRVRIQLNGVRAVFHRPHPGDIMKKYAVEYLREFLSRAGVSP